MIKHEIEKAEIESVDQAGDLLDSLPLPNGGDTDQTTLRATGTVGTVSPNVTPEQQQSCKQTNLAMAGVKLRGGEADQPKATKAAAGRDLRKNQQRRARDSNSQPLAGHHISSVTASHSLTLLAVHCPVIGNDCP